MKALFKRMTLFQSVLAIALAGVVTVSAVSQDAQTVQGAIPSTPLVDQPVVTDIARNAKSRGGKPALVLMPDISRSVKSSNAKMRSVMRRAVESAPGDTIFAIVTVGTKPEKNIFKTRAEAIDYCESLRADSRFTDLSGATDAALAVLQELEPTGPTLFLYLTDGRISLPRAMQTKDDFVAILSREFSRRPNVGVWVLNVSASPIATDTLPPNIKVVPLANWDEAQKQMESTLVPDLRRELTPMVAEQPPTSVEEPEAIVVGTTFGPLGPTELVALGGLVIAFGIASTFAWTQFRRRSTKSIDAADGGIAAGTEDEPADLLRLEDLNRRVSEETMQMVAVVEVITESGRRDRQLFEGDRLVFGNSTDTDVYLAGLKQARSLEIRFDRTGATGFRLRSHSTEIDTVKLDGADAPIRFQIEPGSRLMIGDAEVYVRIMNEKVAAILGQKSPAKGSDETRSDNAGAVARRRSLTARRQSMWN